MSSLFVKFNHISPSGYKYKTNKSNHPFWITESEGDMEYSDLENLPSIGGVEVNGDKSLNDYGIYTMAELEDMLEAKVDVTVLTQYYTASEVDNLLVNKADKPMTVRYNSTDRVFEYYDTDNDEWVEAETGGSSYTPDMKVSNLPHITLGFPYADAIAALEVGSATTIVASVEDLTGSIITNYTGTAQVLTLADNIAELLSSDYGTMKHVTYLVYPTSNLPDGTTASGFIRSAVLQYGDTGAAFQLSDGTTTTTYSISQVIYQSATAVRITVKRLS